MRRLRSLLWLLPLHGLAAAETWEWPDSANFTSYGPDVYAPNGTEIVTEYPADESNHLDGLPFNVTVGDSGPDTAGSSGDDTAAINGTNTFSKRAEDFYLRILPLGASITQGVSSSDGNGYRKHLRSFLRFQGWKVNMVGTKQDGTMADNDNEGYPGAWVHQVREKVAGVAKYKPNVVLINAGTNDCQNGQAPATTASNMRKLLEEVYATWPDTTVILSTLVKSGKGPDVQACAAAVSQEYASLVYNVFRGYRISLANIYDAISPSQIGDETHPTDEGYKLFAAVWAAAINRVAWKIIAPVDVEGLDDAAVGKTTKCKKVAGNARGPFKTQQGSGADDGNYVHSGVPKGSGIIGSGTIMNDVLAPGAPGTVPDYVYFANIVKNNPSAPRDEALDDQIIGNVDDKQKMLWTYRQNLNAEGEFGSTKGLDVDSGCSAANNFAWGDFNNDGLDDFFCITPKAGVWCSLNRGGNPPKFESIGMIVGETDREAREVRIADIDGDGRVDFCLVSDDGPVKCSRNGGKGDEHFWQGFQTQSGIRQTVFSARPSKISGVVLGDINGDFRADFMFIGDTGNVDTYINQRGHGKGIVPDWREAGITHAGMGTSGIQSQIKFGRIYGSGRLDYVYMKKESGRYDMYAWENKGHGGTRRKADGNFYCDMTGSGSDDFVWIYYDGKLDAINANIHSPPNWGHSIKISLTVPGPRMGIHLADWDGDGKCDVLVQNKASGALTLYRNNYQSGQDTMTFTNRGIVAETGCVQGWGVSIFDRGMRIADIDGDGRADPICIETSGRMTAWLNRATGLFNAGQVKFAEDWDRANVRFADVENSGRADIIWMNKYTGASKVFTNNGFAGLGQGGGGSSFRWANRSVLYSGVERGENLYFANIGGLGRADLHQIIDPGTNVAQTHMNECIGGAGGDDGEVSDPGLPAYAANDKDAEIWDGAPVFFQDQIQPFPSLNNTDGTPISTRNMKGTRLFGYHYCSWQDEAKINHAWEDFNSLTSSSRLASNIDWNSAAVRDFFGAGPQKSIPEETKKLIQLKFYYANQMWAHWWDDLRPPVPWWYNWIRVRCRRDHNDKPYDGIAETWNENRYTEVSFGQRYMDDDKKDLWDMTNENNKKSPDDRLNLDIWKDTRGGIWLHESMHMKYYMNTGLKKDGKDPVIEDILIYNQDGAYLERAYGYVNAKRVANYDRSFTSGQWSSRNSDNFLWLALSRWVEEHGNEKTFPYKPEVTNTPLFAPKLPDGVTEKRHTT